MVSICMENWDLGMFPFCVENSGQIWADPTSPPDLSHPYFLDNNDDFAKVGNGHMGEIVEENSFFVTYFHLNFKS